MLCVCGAGVVTEIGEVGVVGVAPLVEFVLCGLLEYTFCPFTLTITSFGEPFALTDFFLCLNL